jgi:GT2 family glycosyltransferase
VTNEVIVAILTCHDRRELTLRALREWFAQRADGVTLTAVLVDDGSTDGTADAVRQQFPQVTVVPADGSLFWARGMELAEREARRLDPTALVWLNDDVVLHPDCLGDLRRVSAAVEPPAVVAGAVADPLTQEPTYGGFAPSRWHALRGSLVGPIGRPLRLSAAHGNILYIPRAAYRRAGIDGGYRHAYADIDYTLRLTRLGYPVLLTPATVGWCSRATTSRGRPPADLPIRQRLRLLNSPFGLPLASQIRFLRRHGGPLWPVLAIAPYVKEAARSVLPRRRT